MADTASEANPFPLGESPRLPVGTPPPVATVIQTRARPACSRRSTGRGSCGRRPRPTASWEVCVGIGGYVPRGAALFQIDGGGAVWHYGPDSPQIPRRMRALLRDLLEATPPIRHAALEQHLTLARATA